jgi:hypothetical protein
MTPDEIETFVCAYIELIATPADSPRYEDLFWTWEIFADASYKNPDFCLKLILAVIERDQSDRVVGCIAAGPTEDLLVYHGSEVIDRVEGLAQEWPLFRKLLAGVWRNDIAQDVWDRIVAVRGEPW